MLGGSQVTENIVLFGESWSADLAEVGKNRFFRPASELTPTLPEVFPLGQLAVADFTVPQIFTLLKEGNTSFDSAQFGLASENQIEFSLFIF